MIYGVYANSDLVHWSPAKIFQNEIKVRVYKIITGLPFDLRLGSDYRFIRANTLLPSCCGLSG